jgi:hypothetical protein
MEPVHRQRDPVRPARSTSGHRLARLLRTRTAPWFAADAVVLVLAVALLHGMTQSIAETAAIFGFLAVCMRYVGLAVRDDSTRSLMVARRGLLGWMAAESSSGRRRRAASRRPR